MHLKHLFSITLVILFSLGVSAQQASETIYKNLKTMNFRTADLDECCPCILKFKEGGKLIREMISCTDCGVGWVKEYDKKGNLQVYGHYKENPTSDWENIWERGYCSVQDGEWIYYSEKGDTLYSEFWDNGIFIKQIPEQKETEIWNVEVSLHGVDVNGESIAPEEVKQLVITPKFKNSNTDSSHISITFEIIHIGYKPFSKVFNLDNFGQIDVNKILSDNNIPLDAPVSVMLKINNYGEPIDWVTFNLVYE